MLLLLKLFLVPTLLLLTSLAGRRWGPRVAGRLAGLPVVIGPLLVVMTLEQGEAFGARAAAAALGGLSAVLAFNVGYAWLCRRRAWPVAWLGATAAWLGAVLVLAAASPGPAAAAGVGVAALLLAPRLFPPLAAPASARAVTRRDLAVRMAAGAALTVAITAVASRLGPAWSGLAATFPVMTTVLAVASHRAHGAHFTGVLLRGMVTGMAGFAAFCAAMAWLLPLVGRGPATVLAVAAALGSQASVPARWRARPAPP